jgi:hypothetical protein
MNWYDTKQFDGSAFPQIHHCFIINHKCVNIHNESVIFKVYTSLYISLTSYNKKETFFSLNPLEEFQISEA